jgi:uncharacterized protein
MPSKPSPFLTAEWRYVLMLNYEIDPAVLLPLLPAGTELDLWQGRALVSMVGFRFLNTRLRGIPVPFHTNFEEVNLRFYVRANPAAEQHAQAGSTGDTGRGVVFVKEIVPLPWVARVANLLYGENYIALPMTHTIERDRQGNLRRDGLVEYTWRYRGRLNRLGGLALGEPSPLDSGSDEAFIAEHYWGYTRRGANKTGVYRVEHPSWRVWTVVQPYLLCDVKSLYGEAFEPFLRARPCSAFLAEGSPVAVFPGKKMTFKPQKK